MEALIKFINKAISAYILGLVLLTEYATQTRKLFIIVLNDIQFKNDSKTEQQVQK